MRLWDTGSGGPVRTPLIERKGDVLSVAFSPDGDGLVAGNGEGDIYGWTLPSAGVLFEPVRGAHTSDVWKLAFSPAGDRFATASSDGTSMVLDYPSGQIVPPFTRFGQFGGWSMRSWESARQPPASRRTNGVPP